MLFGRPAAGRPGTIRQVLDLGETSGGSEAYPGSKADIPGILEPTGSGLKHQRAFGRGFPKGEGSAGLQRVSRCKQKSVSVLPCGFV